MKHILSLAVLATAANAGYTLDKSYDSTNFFDKFNFFSGPDPTNGFVEYVDQAAANQQHLAGYANNAVFMGVDNTTMNPANGRKSVRLESQDTFTRGLFIADIAHMPGSVCGSWPAYWMFGAGWPNDGEIDIIEGVNTQTKNAITLHTGEGCSMAGSVGGAVNGALPGTSMTSVQCSSSGGNNDGCGQQTGDNQGYGDGFNDVGGGVYATEWTSDHIAVWFFQRSRIPANINSGNPDPSSWGQPAAMFAGGSGCNIDSHFKDNQIVFDTTFCGDWAGNAQVWSSDAECSALASTCKDYVSGHPGDFSNSYWLLNSLKVYQQGQGSSSPTPTGTNNINNNNNNNVEQKPKPTTQPPKPSSAPAAVQPSQPAAKPSQPAWNGQTWNGQPQAANNQEQQQKPSAAPAPAPAPTPAQPPSWNGEVWNGQPQAANSPAPAAPAWNGQVWNGQGWNA